MAYATRLRSWYNSLSDLEGDVEGAVGITRQAANATQVVSNNVANLTNPRINLSTLAYIGGGLGLGYVLLKQLRKKNPRGRRRARR